MHPLTEVMGVQHYRSYQALLLGARRSLVVWLTSHYNVRTQTKKNRITVGFSPILCLYTLATGRFKLGFKTQITYISVTSRKKEGRKRGRKEEGSDSGW